MRILKAPATSAAVAGEPPKPGSVVATPVVVESIQVDILPFGEIEINDAIDFKGQGLHPSTSLASRKFTEQEPQPLNCKPVTISKLQPYHPSYY